MVRAIYIGIDPRLTGAAGYSVLAHLEDLVARGIVATDGDPLIDGTYRLAAALGGQCRPVIPPCPRAHRGCAARPRPRIHPPDSGYGFRASPSHSPPRIARLPPRPLTPS